jgi:hypothetical protein
VLLSAASHACQTPHATPESHIIIQLFIHSSHTYCQELHVLRAALHLEHFVSFHEISLKYQEIRTKGIKSGTKTLEKI